jgi:uncharacterized protein YxeA
MKKILMGIFVCMLMILATTTVVGYKKIFNDTSNNIVLNVKNSMSPRENENWMKTFGGWRYDVGVSVQETTDGGYIVAGDRTMFLNSNVWLIKYYGV